MWKVGLTGGMGSGKSVICKIFSTLGIPVFNADSETKALYDTDSDLRRQLIQLLGEEIYKGKLLQRQVMANKIFSNENLLHQVNALVHPVVSKKFETWAAKQDASYVLQEAAILFESGLANYLDKCITVNAPENIRIRRVEERNELAKEAIKQRMQQQWTDQQRAAKADFVIVNDDLQAVFPQVWHIHQQLMKELNK